MSGAVYIDCSPLMRELLTPERARRVPDLRVHEGDPAPDEVTAVVGDAAQVLNGHTSMNAEVLEELPELRHVVFLGTGAASYVDLAAAERLGIRVSTVKGYGDRSVAEHAVALMFAAARRIAGQDAALRAGTWSPEEGVQLHGRTIGIIGASGGIGRETAAICDALGMEVLCWSRRPPETEAHGRHVSLDTLLAGSDIVSLHLAQTPETIGFLDAERIARMRRGAILLNTARWALIDGSALAEALSSGQIWHAALDVFDDEPLPPGAAILRAPNTTLTPHVGFKTRAASIRLLEAGLDLLLE